MSVYQQFSNLTLSSLAHLRLSLADRSLARYIYAPWRRRPICIFTSTCARAHAQLARAVACEEFLGRAQTCVWRGGKCGGVKRAGGSVFTRRWSFLGRRVRARTCWTDWLGGPICRISADWQTARQMDCCKCLAAGDTANPLDEMSLWTKHLPLTTDHADRRPGHTQSASLPDGLAKLPTLSCRRMITAVN